MARAAIELPHGFTRWPDLAAVRARADALGEEWRGQQHFERFLIETAAGADMRGYCVCCASESAFAVNAAPGSDPSWRETLECRGCGLINRLRACRHLFQTFAPQLPDGPVYVSEQTTPFYRWLLERIPDLIGSEFVRPDLPSGTEIEWQGTPVRHEDATAMSFASGSLSAVLSFEVLEHVPNYAAAIAEFARVLMPGGLLLLTAPFAFNLEETVIRARLLPDGGIEHLLPPDYHGDPLSEQGVLCFQYFGWDLLDRMRTSGFSHVELITAWAPEFAYLGSFQPFVVAWR